MTILSATNFAALLSDGAVNNLILGVTIEGIPTMFVERDISAALAGDLGLSYTRVNCITAISEGETAIDFLERREQSATLDIELLDDASNSLRTLFAQNSRAVTFYTADEDETSVSTQALYTTAALPSSGVIYSGRETIEYSSKTATTITPTLNGRGAFNSRGEIKKGSASQGDEVYLVPPFWVGRRVTLWGFLTDNTASGGSTCRLGTYIVDESPKNRGSNKWTIRCAGIMQEFFEQSVGVGLSDTILKQETAVVSTSGGVPIMSIEPELAGRFRLGTSFPTYIIVTHDDDEKTIHELISAGASTITYRINPSFGMDLAKGWRYPVSAQMMGVIGGTSGAALLRVLLSNEGQSAVDSRDVLPGRKAEFVGDTGWRIGANLTTTEVSTTSIVNTHTLLEFTYFIDQQIKLTELLKEFGILSNSCFTATRDGKIKVASLNAPISASLTITANDIIPDQEISVESDEEGAYPLVRLKCGYSPILREYNTEVNLIDEPLFKRMARMPRTLDLDLRSIGCTDGQRVRKEKFTNPSSHNVPLLAPVISNLVKADGNLCNRFLSLRLGLHRLDIELGDVCALSGSLPDEFTQMPDFIGGVISGNMLRLMAKRPNYAEGYIDCKFQILETPLVISPSAVITAEAGGGTILTLSTTSIDANSSPVNDFWVGAVVRIYDRSARTYVTRTISTLSPGFNQITLSVAVGFAIQTGIDYLALDPATSGAGTSVSGYTLANMAIMADLDGTSGSLSPRWG